MQPRRSKIREKSEFEHKMIDLRRVARVEKGGRRFSFRAAVVAGNRRGKVGVGIGKGADTAAAIDKALRGAKKYAVQVTLDDAGSISRDVEAKYSSARVFIRKAPEGTGLVAGSAVRTVLDFAGIRNATAKIISHTKNKINNAGAAIAALRKLEARENSEKAKESSPAVSA